MPRINLKELAARESEQVEWKENVADIADVIATAVAFSNDLANLGGGYIVCGAAEARDEHGFPLMRLPGLTSSRFREIEGSVMNACRIHVRPPILPLVETLEAETADRRVLIFVVPATEQAHSYRKSNKDVDTYYIRHSHSTIEARNGLLRELLVRKQALPPWDRRHQSTATAADIDLLVFRDVMQRIGLWDPSRSIEDYLSPDNPISVLAPPLAMREPLGGPLRPLNYTLLLFGKQPQRIYTDSYAIFSIYPGKDRSDPHAERIEITGTLIEQANKLISLLNTQSYTFFDKNDKSPNLEKYPQKALQEAVINALVHRDYEINRPVRITVFVDRIEISSPGGLPTAIKPEQFLSGQAPPVWRNRSLAFFFNRLNLAQAEGQGIPTIFRAMSETGCPAPVFDIGPESVTCTLPAHPRHALLRDVREIERELVLGHLAEAEMRARILLDKDPYNFRVLELYCEANTLANTPIRVFNWLTEKQIDIEKLSAPAWLRLAETLQTIKEPSIDTQRTTRLLLVKASKGSLQETEAKKVAIALRKTGDNEGAIEVVNRMLESTPSLKTSHQLLQLRGRSYIDLAKRCVDTARNPSASAKMKGAAWNQCRAYLSDAEKDLRSALEHVYSSVDRDYLEKDLQFLERLKQQAKKPMPRQR